MAVKDLKAPHDRWTCRGWSWRASRRLAHPQCGRWNLRRYFGRRRGRLMDGNSGSDADYRIDSARVSQPSVRQMCVYWGKWGMGWDRAAIPKVRKRERDSEIDRWEAKGRVAPTERRSVHWEHGQMWSARHRASAGASCLQPRATKEHPALLAGQRWVRGMNERRGMSRQWEQLASARRVTSNLNRPEDTDQNNTSPALDATCIPLA